MRRLAGVLVCILAVGTAASAQLFTATSEFRVVNVDPAERRIGVALLDAHPDVIQNWVYLKDQTRVTQQGSQPWHVEGALAGLRKGDIIKVHGGRDFDGSINAKTLDLVTPGPPAAAAQEGGVPYGAALWNGTVQEVTAQSVVLETATGQSVLLPRTSAFSLDGAAVAAGSLQPGMKVTANVPGGTGTLVSANGEVATLNSADGLVQVPTSAIPPTTQVPVLTRSGSSLSMPLDSALQLQRSEGASILAPGYHTVQEVQNTGGHGVVLSSDPLIVATPDGGVVRLPRSSKVKYTPGAGVEWKAGKVESWKGKGKPPWAGKGKGR